MAIELTDDGTLDTVLRCSECGEEMRYTYEPDDQNCPVCGADECSGCMCALDKTAWEKARMKQYDEFVDWAIEDATNEHECPNDPDAEPTEPQEDDITTEDHVRFYESGRLVLQRNGKPYMELRDSWDAYLNRRWVSLGNFGDDYAAAVREYCNRSQYWPNVWFISDHGNAHLIDLSEGK